MPAGSLALQVHQLFNGIEDVYMTEIMEALALLILAYDVLKRKPEHVSVQTCLALTISHLIGATNLPDSWSQTYAKMAILTVGVTSGCIATYRLAKHGGIEGEDDLPIPGLTSNMRKAIVYLVPMVCGLFVMLCMAQFSLHKFLNFRVAVFYVSTQNFINAVGLMPQVMLSRQRGSVAPAAVRLFFLQGVKEIIEFTLDSQAVYTGYKEGTIVPHDLCFLFSDFIAALVLLDFLYLVISDKSKTALLTGQKELELLDAMEFGEVDIMDCVPIVKAVMPTVQAVAKCQTTHGQFVLCGVAFIITIAGFFSDVLSIFSVALAFACIPAMIWAFNMYLVKPKLVKKPIEVRK
eukprot:TRINITY_DN45665_c0_g1_i1.p1 TRINITY_DN45665_c0_g1~~TRINITY_DN45665_c0_g1_i1.p1  ORF type:complete len:349 (+),score=84.17 TRINITY_DN45665_c0_g1_i1:76-1122(+)